MYNFHKKNPLIVHNNELQTSSISDNEWVYVYHEFQTDTHQTISSQTDLYRLPYIFPKTLIRCCARNNCLVGDNNIYFEESIPAPSRPKYTILEFKSEAQICKLCCNYTCSEICMGKYNFCLHCETEFLCSNGNMCAGYGGEGEELLPNWLLKKSRVSQEYQLEQYQSSKFYCKDCSTTICRDCVDYFCSKTHSFISRSTCVYKKKRKTFVTTMKNKIN